MVSEERKERVLRRLLRLVDMSLDLDRQREDKELSEKRKLHTVIDENILEMSIKPSRYFRSTEAFYDRLWFSPDQIRAGQTFESQAVMIAAEYLLGDGNSASKMSRLLITRRHRIEFAVRVGWMQEEIRDKIDRWTPSHRNKMLVEHNKKWTDLGSPEFLRAARERNALLHMDLEMLAKSSPDATASTLDQIARARIAAERFVETGNDVLETLEQLSRALSPALRKRLHTIEDIYNTSNAEQAQIEQEAKIWAKRLKSELLKPGHRDTVRAIVLYDNDPERVRAVTRMEPEQAYERTLAALAGDARSLAYLRWVARNKIPKGERLVFVTADAVLFDTYRRWFSEPRDPGESDDDSKPDETEAFMLRRARQYGPLFNSIDIAREGDVDPFHSQVQLALATTKFPLAFVGDNERPFDPGDSLNQRRERVALKSVDTVLLINDKEFEFLSSQLDERWFEDQENRLSDIRDRWREMQRMAIGAAHELIAARFSEERRAAAAAFSDDTRSVDEITSKYLNTLISKVLLDSVEVWRGIAESLDEPKDGDGPPRPPNRLTLTTHLNGALGVLPPRARNSAAQSPEFMFARAACRLLELQDVELAVRFLSAARRANNASARKRRPIRGLSLELRYLEAVTNRFQIGSIDDLLVDGNADRENSELREKTIDRIYELYAASLAAIDFCLGAHDLSADSLFPEHPDYDAVRYLRALSERAALSLFIVIALHFAKTDYPGDFRAPLYYLNKARTDLASCLRFDKNLKCEDVIRNAVREQFLPNIASAEVIRFLLLGPGGYVFDETLRKAIDDIDGFANTGGFHTLLSAELRAFFVLAGHARATDGELDVDQQVGKFGDPRLALDNALFQAIRRSILGASDTETRQ